jgi:hypothetical protein
MHDDIITERSSEFDREMRRRLWMTMFSWDRAMGMVLSRPFLIAQEKCTLPSVNLEFDPAYPDIPSPVTQVKLQYQLLESISKVLPLSSRNVSCDAALAAKTKIDTWALDLPAVFQLRDPDTRYNSTHKFLARHRLQTLCIGYATASSILKPYLILSDPALSLFETHKRVELRLAAIDTCLKLMEIAKGLFDMFIPNSPKYFQVIFVPFDTAAVLCSAVIHDKDNSLPRRAEILQAIGTALAMIRVMRPLTKTGTIIWDVLSVLILKMHLTAEEAMSVDPDSMILTKERRPAKRVALQSETPPSLAEMQIPAFMPSPEATSSSSENTPEFDWQFNPTEALDGTTMNLSEIDLDILDPLWGWDDVNLSSEDSFTSAFKGRAPIF